MSRRPTTKALIGELRELCKMERFSCAFPSDKLEVRMLHHADETIHPDEFIKRETRLWRETWVLPLIDKIEERLCK